MKNNLKMKTALTIAGSDSIGGAGIQADLKTMCCLGVYGMSAITALTAQNTTGVVDIFEVSPEFLQKQLDCVFTDIFPDAVKTGMLSDSKLIAVIADTLKKYKAKNIVIDPVMVSTSGSRLIKEEAVNSLKELLFPISDIITPNIPEAEILGETEIHTRADMETVCRKISEKYGCSVLCKGGHSVEDSNDVLFHKGNIIWFESTRINNPNTHGTGCTLSSAIASYLALGESVENSVKLAKEYLTGAISAGLDLGKGSGPLAHNYKIIKGKV